MPTAEEWRACPENDHYEVSSLGRVRRAVPARNTWAGRVLKPALRNGYPFVQFCKNNQVTSHSVHRLVLNAFVGPCPEGMEAHHRNATKTDNCAENLEYRTPGDNNAESYRIGNRDARGEGNGQAKLTAKDVRFIRSHSPYERGLFTRLARRFGVSDTTVRDAAHGRTWGHLA